MKSAVGKRFPLRQAYPFAEAHGLGDQVKSIKDMHINWDGKYTYISTVRRGFMIDLLDQKGILDTFFNKKWRRGLTEAGRKECEFCLRLMEVYKDLYPQS